MHTIQLQVEDSLYDKIVKSGMELKEKFDEFLQYELSDDEYPAISTDEAKQRVSKAVEEYRSGKTNTINHSDVWKEIDKRLGSKIK